MVKAFLFCTWYPWALQEQLSKQWKFLPKHSHTTPSCPLQPLEDKVPPHSLREKEIGTICISATQIKLEPMLDALSSQRHLEIITKSVAISWSRLLSFPQIVLFCLIDTQLSMVWNHLLEYLTWKLLCYCDLKVITFSGISRSFGWTCKYSK